MAYVIKLQNTVAEPSVILRELIDTLERDGRFRFLDKPGYIGSIITLGKVRLNKSKPYCGQHPGECLAGGPKRKGTWLEWEDWVAFHSLVNDVLDQLDVRAEVTTKPAESIDRHKGLRVGYMYIRQGAKRRLRYEWDERMGQFGRTVRWWNPGTPDQFEPLEA